MPFLLRTAYSPGSFRTFPQRLLHSLKVFSRTTEIPPSVIFSVFFPNSRTSTNTDICTLSEGERSNLRLFIFGVDLCPNPRQCSTVAQRFMRHGVSGNQIQQCMCIAAIEPV